MSLCELKPTGQQAMKDNGTIYHQLKCERCGRQVWSKDPPQKTHANCKVAAQKKALARAVWDFGQALVRFQTEGRPVVSQQVYDERRAICEGCPLLSRRKFCGSCNCYMPVKAWLATEACPVGKWARSQPSP